MHNAPSTAARPASLQLPDPTTRSPERPSFDPDERFSGWTMQQWLDYDPGKVERWLRRLTPWIWDHGFRLRSYGMENIPRGTPYVFCPNHSSYLDGVFQVRAIPGENLRFMAKSSVFEVPGLGWFMRAGGGFPVRRGESDAFAVELARRFLERGDHVGIYMEGTRYRDADELGPPRSGAARIALELGVPIVPVATYGAKPRTALGRSVWSVRLPKVTTLYGEPFDFSHLAPTRENTAHVRDTVWAEVERLYGLARELTTSGRRPRSWVVPGRG